MHLLLNLFIECLRLSLMIWVVWHKYFSNEICFLSWAFGLFILTCYYSRRCYYFLIYSSTFYGFFFIIFEEALFQDFYFLKYSNKRKYILISMLKVSTNKKLHVVLALYQIKNWCVQKRQQQKKTVFQKYWSENFIDFVAVIFRKNETCTDDRQMFYSL